MPDEQSREELLRRARELHNKAGESGDDRSRLHESTAERLSRQNPLVRSLFRASDRLRDSLGPVGTVLSYLIRWLGIWLRWLAFEPTNGDLNSVRFSKFRALRNLLLTILVIFGVHIAASAAYYYGTHFEETVYVTGKQEIVTGELYQFGGCTSLPCSTAADNGKFYLVESSLYFPLLLYPEEEVFANIPHQNAACNVRGYGIYFRALRWIYKTFQLYQHVVDVSCRPYTEDEIRRTVTDGEIVRDPVSED